MPPIWFLVFVALCAIFPIRATIRGFRGDGFYVRGQKQSSITVVLAWAIILTVIGIMAAIGLGFVPNAP